MPMYPNNGTWRPVLRFLTRAQMLMHAILDTGLTLGQKWKKSQHGGSTNTVRDSAVKVDWERREKITARGQY